MHVLTPESHEHESRLTCPVRKLGGVGHGYEVRASLRVAVT